MLVYDSLTCHKTPFGTQTGNVLIDFSFLVCPHLVSRLSGVNEYLVMMMMMTLIIIIEFL